MRPRRGSQPEVEFVWQRSGVHALFHYTNRNFAEQIHAEQVYVVSDRPHQRYGHGLFLTSIEPEALSKQELLRRLFAMQRPPEAVEAVVVLHQDDECLPVERVSPGIYLCAAPAGAEIDLALVYLGYGTRAASGREWLFSRELHVPKT